MVGVEPASGIKIVVAIDPDSSLRHAVALAECLFRSDDVDACTGPDDAAGHVGIAIRDEPPDIGVTVDHRVEVEGESAIFLDVHPLGDPGDEEVPLVAVPRPVLLAAKPRAARGIADLPVVGVEPAARACVKIAINPNSSVNEFPIGTCRHSAFDYINSAVRWQHEAGRVEAALVEKPAEIGVASRYVVEVPTIKGVSFGVRLQRTALPECHPGRACPGRVELAPETGRAGRGGGPEAGWQEDGACAITVPIDENLPFVQAEKIQAEAFCRLRKHRIGARLRPQPRASREGARSSHEPTSPGVT